MIGQAVAMIAGEDDDRIVEIPLPLQRRDDLAHLFVDHRHVGQIVRPLSMPLLLRRIQIHDHRIVIDVLVVLAEFLQRRRLRIQFFVE